MTQSTIRLPKALPGEHYRVSANSWLMTLRKLLYRCSLSIRCIAQTGRTFLHAHINVQLCEQRLRMLQISRSKSLCKPGIRFL